MKRAGHARDDKVLQELLNLHILIVVQINPEARGRGFLHDRSLDLAGLGTYYTVIITRARRDDGRDGFNGSAY